MCVVHCTSMNNSTITATTDMTAKLGITFPKSIVQKIDNKRADIPRSRYIRRAIERYLGNNSNKGIDNKDNKAAATTKKSRRNK
jgi:metal-responsive CopG/Arc/MetJ family transcriptional regulator